MAKSEAWSVRYGSRAIVTGAGSGIGACFATRAVEAGLDVVLVDRDGGALERHAEKLRAMGKSDVSLLVGDLTDPAFVDRVCRLADERVGLVVHSAGITSMGRFLDLAIEPQLRAVELHCRTSVAFAHAFGRTMRARGGGGIVLLSSNSAYLHAPLVSNYAATKAYTLALGEALWEELRHEGVDVLVLVPGMTATALLDGSSPNLERAASFIQTPEAVVDGALAALGNEPVYVSSAKDRIAATLFKRLLPRRMALALARRSMTYFFPQHGE